MSTYYSFIFFCVHTCILYSFTLRGLMFTKTGRIVRWPEKFQCADTLDPRKLFKKPVPQKKEESTPQPDFSTPHTENDRYSK